MRNWVILLAASTALTAPGHAATAPLPEVAADTFSAFVPRHDGRDNRLDYSVWTEALAAFVVSMGPPLRKMPIAIAPPIGSRVKFGPQSMYRLDGSLVGFTLIDREVMGNIGRYRRELEAVAETLDIPALPRNEQLAYWINLHNVAMVEKIGEEWPIRQPREIMVDGVPLDDARFVTVRGVSLSLRDIRERIVFAHWKDPVVIYGFWRGEIGGPAIQRAAFDGREISAQLESSAREFINSRRGTEKRGDTLHVSRFYAEMAPFYFPDLEADLRAHLARYAEGPVIDMLADTGVIKASIYEHDIADLSGGRRSNPFFASGRLDVGADIVLQERERKFEYIRRTQPRTRIVTFSNIDLPGDPPNKGEVE